MNINEFNKAIDKEVAALESLFTLEEGNYHQTHRLQNKPWYGIGLEDNEVAVQKDNTAKEGVGKRMLDVIINFIKRIAEWVAKFFSKRDDAAVKANLEVAKNYKGPTKEQLAEVKAPVDKEATKGQPAPAAEKPLAESEKVKVYESEKLKKIRSRLGVSGMTLGHAIFNKEAYDAFNHAWSAMTKLTQVTPSLEAMGTVPELVDKLEVYNKNLKWRLDQSKEVEPEKQAEFLTGWISGGGYDVGDWLTGYIMSKQYATTAVTWNTRLAHTLSRLDAGKITGSQDEIAACRVTVQAMGEFTTLLAKMFEISNVIVEMISEK